MMGQNDRDGGFVLITSLVFLLVVSSLALTTLRSSLLTTKMADAYLVGVMGSDPYRSQTLGN